MNTLVSNVIDSFESILVGIQDYLRFNPKRLFDLETADSEGIFVTKDRGLVSVIALRGVTQLIGAQEYKNLVACWEEWLAPFAKSGHDFAFIYEEDTEGVVERLERNFDGIRQQSKRLGIDVSDIIDEKIERNVPYVHNDTAYLVVSTHLRAFRKFELKELRKKHKEEQSKTSGKGDELVAASEAMESAIYYDDMRLKHIEMVQNIYNKVVSTPQASTLCELLSTVSATRTIKRQLDSEGVAETWKPETLDIGEVIPKLPLNGKRRFDISHLLPRKLEDQLIEESENIGSRYAFIGNRFYSAISVERMAFERKPFADLVSILHENRMPFRIAIWLLGDGMKYREWNAQLAHNLKWLSRQNRNISEALDGLKTLADKGKAIVAPAISAVTWASAKELVTDSGKVKYDLELIRQRSVRLSTALQTWGDQQTSDRVGDTVEGVLSATAACLSQPIAPLHQYPLNEVLKCVRLNDRPLSGIRALCYCGRLVAQYSHFSKTVRYKAPMSRCLWGLWGMPSPQLLTCLI